MSTKTVTLPLEEYESLLSKIDLLEKSYAKSIWVDILSSNNPIYMVYSSKEDLDSSLKTTIELLSNNVSVLHDEKREYKRLLQKLESSKKIFGYKIVKS